MISDAAKQVKVESHVLRYWEEELHLPIKRNELGHRYYTKEDVERFKEIKSMKERGLQLKAIKMILKDGRLDVLPEEREKEPVEARKEPAEVRTPHMAIEIVDKPVDKEMPVQPQERICTVPEKEGLQSESREEKAKRLQWILQQLIREAVRENNQDLCRELKESMVKELDYQFRSREEREEERDRRLEQRSEEYRTEDAEVVLIGYGISGRLCRSAVDELRAKGIKAGLLRPVTLWPIPVDAIRKQTQAKEFIAVEMSDGQMIDDVKLAISCDRPVHLINRMGGNIATIDEIVARTIAAIGAKEA